MQSIELFGKYQKYERYDYYKWLFTPYPISLDNDALAKMTDAAIYTRTRLSRDALVTLFNRIRDAGLNSTNRHRALHPMQQLVLTLIYISSGEYCTGMIDSSNTLLE